MTVTKNSVTGKANHIPKLDNKLDRMNAEGIIITNPLRIDMICAGFACSVDVK